jgi:hypothetical protein
MEPNSEESSIERLKRNLYSRNEKLVPKEKRTPVSPHEVIDVKENWGTDTNFNLSPEEMAKKNNSFFNKFLLGSLLFFLISLGVAAFIFFGGLNMISSNNLDVKVTAPSSVSSGEELPIGLSIVNGNRTDLEEAVLFIEYPEGSESVEEQGKILTRGKLELGIIPKGKSSEQNLNLVLFGEKDAIKTFTFRIEYKVKGSNAVFSKEKKFDVSISSSPLLLDVNYPKEVNSGQIVSISIDLTSNSNIPVKNTLVKVEYPYGYIYKDSTMTPYRDNNIWNIGDLKDGDKKTLTIRGVLVGQNLEDRSFRVSAGSQSQDNSRDFDTTLATGIFTMGIRKSFYDLSVDYNQQNAPIAGQSIPIDIKWQNTLPDKIINSHIEVSLSGNAFDRSRVNVGGGGFYKSIDNTITWDKNTTPILSSILPGESNHIDFSVTSFDDMATNKLIKNPHIDMHVVISGDRLGSDSSTVTSEEDLTVKIGTNVGIKAKTLRDVGPFTNTGPLPPKADKETTYTVTLSLSNTTNDIKNTVVTTTLPVGVEWKNETSPSGEKVSYDSSSRTVTWNVGNVSAGIGYGYAPREASFKVGLTPSINQIGTTPNLTTSVNVSALDTYTEKQVSSSASELNTRYFDSTFVNGKETVTK